MPTVITDSTNRFALFATAFVALIVLAGCAGGPPSENEAGSKLQEVISENSEGAIELTDFRKVDGQGREESGVRVYEMDVEGRVEIREECYWRPPGRSSLGEAFSVASASEQEGYWESFAKKSSGRVRASEGERHSFAGSITFEEKESGWTFSNMDLGTQSSE